MSNPFHEYCPKCDAHHAAGDCTAWLRKQRTELRSALAASQEREGKALETLKNLLFAHENADETGYVADVGFLDVDAICKTAHELTDKALSTPSDAGRGGWLPIETAPKDGRPIMAVVSPSPRKWSHSIIWFHPYDPNERGSNQWYEGMMPLVGRKPTHWMPLPQPPPASGEEKGGES